MLGHELELPSKSGVSEEGPDSGILSLPLLVSVSGAKLALESEWVLAAKLALASE